ncbi:hypothetical protein AM588_10006339 [Phytophthora nicotianae]|uniref:Uncharacterized protein n=1 Tax=Phytophthora nicotianae TaxID=4792 RepID=A0A0W8D0M8_PHYNI|nr:hypothetical protein AM588_10006339 [Phytophthora nicotianae]
MISSHYDAAIGGAAASDDGVNIAIMMELLRMFVLNPPKHATLVFNFNGAEETIMQAAHGFITQHPWTDAIRAFINLEAAGAGGRELLFQTGSDELALAYAQGAKYPHASIIAQELFQSGIIPADTDYRIYRDFVATAYASIRNPYSDICPKRLMLQHVQREVILPNGDIQTDSGLWINSLDFRGPDPIKSYLSNTQWKDARMHVARKSYTSTQKLKHMLPEDKSWYLPAAAPTLPNDAHKARLEVLSSTYSADTDRRKIHFVFTGPSHMNLFIDAKKTKLTSWSMGNGVSGPVVEAEDAYILQFCSGAVPSSYHFWIEAESNKPIDVAFVGHFLEVTTPEMKEFTDVLPSWTVVASAVSTWTKMQI